MSEAVGSAKGREMGMIIVAGHLDIDPVRRSVFVEEARGVVVAAREARGCLDFSMAEDLLDPRRVNVFERWADAEALDRFRGDGPSGEHRDAILSVSVHQYDVQDTESPA